MGDLKGREVGYLSRIHRGKELYSRWGIRKEGIGIPKQDTQGAGTLQQVGD